MTKELENKICKVIKVILKIQGTKKVQMFDCYSLTDDYKEIFLCEDNIKVLYAPGYEYVEIIGLSNKDYQKIFKKYGY